MNMFIIKGLVAVNLGRVRLDPVRVLWLWGMAAAGIGHGLGVDVGNAASQRNRLGTGVQRQEFAIRAVTERMTDFLAQRADDAQLRQARRHDVGHHLRFAHGRDDIGRRVAEAEHAVAAGVVQHPAL